MRGKKGPTRPDVLLGKHLPRTIFIRVSENDVDKVAI
jgi:hypothetical protein